MSFKDLIVDPPVEIQNFGFKSDRAYIDQQILILEQHMLDSVLFGVHCTWVTVDTTVAGTLAAQSVVTSIGVAPDGSPSVVKVDNTNAAQFLGITLTAAAANGKVLVALGGVLPAEKTGIVNGGLAGYGVIDTGTGVPQFVSTLLPTHVLLGRVNTAGLLTLFGPNLNSSGPGGLTGTSTTTSPSAGVAGALPATPTGYLSILINGAGPYKIAYY